MSNDLLAVLAAAFLVLVVLGCVWALNRAIEQFDEEFSDDDFRILDAKRRPHDDTHSDP